MLCKPRILSLFPNSFNEFNKTRAHMYDTLYITGVMAGMGVALLVVFFILGIVGMYIFYRKRGGAFLPKKFVNEDNTQSEEPVDGKF